MCSFSLFYRYFQFFQQTCGPSDDYNKTQVVSVPLRVINPKYYWSQARVDSGRKGFGDLERVEKHCPDPMEKPGRANGEIDRKGQVDGKRVNPL